MWRAVCARRIVAGLVSVVAVAPTLLASPTTARAQTAGSSTLELVSQAPWTEVGGEIRARIETGIDDAGLTVSVVAHQAMDSRTGFERSTRGEALGSVLDQVVVPLAALRADAAGTRELVVGLQPASGPRDNARLAIRRAGVYPLAVELRDSDDQTLSRFVTYAVVVARGIGGEAIARRLGVAWVWPLVAPPSTLPDGRPDPGALDELRPGGRIGRQAAALARSPEVPVTLQPGGETFDAWSFLGRTESGALVGLNDLQGAVDTTQVLTGPYVPVNLPSLLAGNLGIAADAELVAGDDALKRYFDQRVDTRTALADPVDTASLARLRARRFDRFVVLPSSLAPASSRLTPAAPFSLEVPTALVPGGSVPAVVSDQALQRLLTGDDSPALRAQRFLAGLSITALELPGRARGVVVVNPEGFDPEPSLLDAVFTGLGTHPWLRPMTVGEVFDTVPPATRDDDMPAVRELARYDPPAPPVTLAEYIRAQTRLDGFRSLVGAPDQRVLRGERALLLAVSSSFGGDAGRKRARAELGAIDALVDDFVGKIQVPGRNTITLTARSGEIPLTFRNETGRAVRVRLHVESQKLFFPEGATRTVMLPPRSTTVRLAVEARTSGSFPLRLVLSSVDGRLPITDTRFRVRSTFVSTVGIGLTAGAGMFLVLWWGWDFRRRRRARRAAAQAA